MTDYSQTGSFSLLAGKSLGTMPLLVGTPTMTTAEVVQVLTRLAEGKDPVTGQHLPNESPCNHPLVIRALFGAVERLQHEERPRAVSAPATTKAGSYWSSSEDQQLVREMSEGTRLMDIARTHGRSRGAILTRVVRLGYFKSMEDARSALEHGKPLTNWAILKKERPQAGKTWSKDEDEKLLQAHDAGLTPDDIARHLGRGVFSIQVRLAKLGNRSDAMLNTEETVPE